MNEFCVAILQLVIMLLAIDFIWHKAIRHQAFRPTVTLWCFRSVGALIGRVIAAIGQGVVRLCRHQAGQNQQHP